MHRVGLIGGGQGRSGGSCVPIEEIHCGSVKGHGLISALLLVATMNADRLWDAPAPLETVVQDA
jgi:hypothetical protein